MREFKNQISDFVNNKIDLYTYVNFIKDYHISNQNDFTNFLETYDNNNMMDERMNAFLILWILKSKHFIFNKTNQYLNYLTSITNEMTNASINSIDISYLNYTSNFLISKVNDFYFIINHSNKELDIPLINDLKNKTVYCFNCGDDLYFEESLTLPEYSFYAVRISND